MNPLLHPRLASAVFFPRPDDPWGPEAPGALEHLFEVEPGVRSRLRIFLAAEATAPTILFFHGNGETARDYDHAAAAFRALPASLVVAEYRGYGLAQGQPTLAALGGDAHAALDELRSLLQTEQRSGPLVVMGRSLGSAPAIELASARGDTLDGLIVESGFGDIVPLLELLGIPARQLGVTEAHGPRNVEKMARVQLPTLLLHAEQDQILPMRNAEALYAASADPGCVLVRVPGAGHNDIQARAGQRYFDALGELLGRVAEES